jgi:hypothetical protein
MPTSGDREEGWKPFVEAFGVSEEELRRQGIDPLEFAQERGAIVSPGLRRSGAADEELWTLYRRWGLRFYAGAFITLGFFAIAYALRHHEVLNIAVKTTAGVVGAVAISTGVIALGYWFRYAQARRRAGLPWRRL